MVQDQDKILGIIPARGGSKSIPRKNIKMLAGKPLIAWTILAAKKSQYLNRLIVSTDDEEIAEIAKSYGAEVPFLRPAAISGDRAHDMEFFLHALDFLKERENYEPNLILRLAPTSPLRQAASIDEGIEVMFGNPEADSARSVMETPKHPFKMYYLRQGQKYLEPFLGKAFTKMDEPWNMPRQALPVLYIHTGAVDVTRLKTIRVLKSLTGRKIAYFFMKPEDSVNIDQPLDFEVAEILMRQRLAGNQ